MKAFISFLLLAAVTTFAQAPRMDTLVSPEVHPDRSVTFRVRAPKASEVSLFGDWMMTGTQQAMTRDEQGVWSTTTGPLEPGLAIYTLTVDGVTTPDPSNPRIKLRARTSEFDRFQTFSASARSYPLLCRSGQYGQAIC